jgi:uncharacterized protein
MIINVEGLAQGTRDIEAVCTPAQLALQDSDLKFLNKIHILARVNRMGDDVFIQSQLRATLSQTCCRCLETYALDVETKSQTLFVPERPPKHYRHDVRRPILDDEDGKVARYKGKTIDLSTEIADALRLCLPMKPLCQTGCKGLCPHCGANLNQKTCDCAPGPAPSRNNPFGEIQSKLKGRK